MKILHVYSGNLFGGVETLLLQLFQLSKKNSSLEHSYALFFEGTLSKALKKEGAEVFSLTNASFRKPWTVFSARQKLQALLLSSKPDIVISHDLWTYVIIASTVRSSKISSLCWLHSGAGGSWYEMWLRFTPPSKIIACSNYVAQSLQKKFPQIPVGVCYAPLSLERFETDSKSRNEIRQNIRAKYNIGEDETVILMVARLSPLKGHLHLIEAAKKLRSENFRVLIVGSAATKDEENYRQKLLSASKSNNRIILVNAEELPIFHFYFAADIYCQPNELPDSYGFTFIEAMKAGLPVVTIDFGGAAEILRDPTSGKKLGFLIMDNSERDTNLFKILNELVENHELRNQNQSEIKQRAAQLSDSSFLYKKIITELTQVF